MKKAIALSSAAILTINLTACGTILYPERKGQVDGKLDPAIVMLDAVGLLLFFVPGVIAFAVDFSNGTIYLPGGKSAALDSGDMDKIVKNGKVDTTSLKEAVDNQSEEPTPYDSQDLRAIKIDKRDEISKYIDVYSQTIIARADLF